MSGPGWQDLLEEEDLPSGEDAMDHLDFEEDEQFCDLCGNQIFSGPDCVTCQDTWHSYDD